MHELPISTGPKIYLYESLQELRDQLQYPYTHGLYEPEKNCIHATYDSLAHEIAHFKDYTSGAWRNSPTETLPLRNELVAVLFAWKQHPKPSAFLKHEQEFLEWYFYMNESKKLPGDPSLRSLSFKEIQKLADDITHSKTRSFQKPKKLFRHYLEVCFEADHGKILSISRG